LFSSVGYLQHFKGFVDKINPQYLYDAVLYYLCKYFKVLDTISNFSNVIFFFSRRFPLCSLLVYYLKTWIRFSVGILQLTLRSSSTQICLCFPTSGYLMKVTPEALFTLFGMFVSTSLFTETAVKIQTKVCHEQIIKQFGS